MGKKKQKKQTVTYTPIAQQSAAIDPVQIQQQQQQLQQNYQSQVEQIQKTSQQSIESINQSNQAAMAAIQTQLEASNRDKLNYQQSLQDYLKQLQQLQGQYTAEIANRDAAVQQQQQLQTREVEGNNTMNNLLAASTIASQQFTRNTRRRGVIA